MKNKIFSLMLFLSIITISGVWAQNLPSFPIAPGTASKHTWASSIWTSPQSATTEGRFRSNADDFIRPDAYAGVKFNKWFGMASFLWAGEENSGEMIATLGFATKTDNVYIGALYTGNMWTNMQINNYTEEEPAAAPIGGVTGKTYNVYNSISVSADPGNNVAVLFGFANMGLRLTYRTNYQSFEKSDIVARKGNTSQLYDSYQIDEGYIAPQIAWAMAKDLTKNGIKPYAAVDLVFYREFKKTKEAGDSISGENIAYSKNRFDPSLSAGLGGYTFYNKDGFKGSFDLDYVLTLNIYDNEYSYAEDGKYKTGRIKGTFSENSNPFIEESFISNSLTPSFSGSWSKDALALKFKLNLPLTYSETERNSMALNSDNKLFYKGQSESTSTFTFRPDIRLAMQYKAIPNRLILNVGARVQATTLTLETIEQNIYDNSGEITSKKKIHRDSVLNSATGTQFISRFNVGPTLNFTENAWVEATTGVTKVFGDAAVDVFAPGGLFSFGSILFAVKF